MSCRDCIHFNHKYTNKDGRQSGMCRAWEFSINENDDRGCSKKEPKPTAEQRRRDEDER